MRAQSTTHHKYNNAILLADPAFLAHYQELRIGYQIARLRILRNLTQKKLAMKVGSAPSTLSLLETSKFLPSLPLLMDVADALDAKVDILFVSKDAKYGPIEIDSRVGGSRCLQVPPLTTDQLAELEDLYLNTTSPQDRTRAQMVLLSAEQGYKAEDIAKIVLEPYPTVLRWLKRYLNEGIDGLKNEGIDGLKDVPRHAWNTKVTEAYRQRLLEVVRQSPPSLGLEYPSWSLRRLADYLAEETGMRVTHQTIWRELTKAGIALKRSNTIPSPGPQGQIKKKSLDKS